MEKCTVLNVKSANATKKLLPNNYVPTTTAGLDAMAIFIQDPQSLNVKIAKQSLMYEERATYRRFAILASLKDIGCAKEQIGVAKVFGNNTK